MSALITYHLGLAGIHIEVQLNKRAPKEPTFVHPQGIVARKSTGNLGLMVPWGDVVGHLGWAMAQSPELRGAVIESLDGELKAAHARITELEAQPRTVVADRIDTVNM